MFVGEFFSCSLLFVFNLKWFQNTIAIVKFQDIEGVGTLVDFDGMRDALCILDNSYQTLCV
jgi:hypothetical protein